MGTFFQLKISSGIDVFYTVRCVSYLQQDLMKTLFSEITAFIITTRLHVPYIYTNTNRDIYWLVSRGYMVKTITDSCIPPDASLKSFRHNSFGLLKLILLTI